MMAMDKIVGRKRVIWGPAGAGNETTRLLYRDKLRRYYCLFAHNRPGGACFCLSKSFGMLPGHTGAALV